MTRVEVLAVGLYVLPMLVWALIAADLWSYARTRRSPSRFLHLAPAVATALTLHFLILLLLAAVPGSPADPLEKIAHPAHAAHEVSWLVCLALLRHLLRVVPLPERTPGRLWLAGNYGMAGVAAAADVLARAGAAAHPALGHRVFELGFFVLAFLCLWELRRMARPGAWGPEHAGELRRPDVLLIAWGTAASIVATPVAFLVGGVPLATVLWEVAIGLTIAAPFAVRMLGAIVPKLLAAVALVAATTGLLAVQARTAAVVPARFHPLLGVVVVLLIALVLVPAHPWLRTRFAAVVLRRRLRQQAALQTFLHSLSPELGVSECCRRTLAELVRVRQLRGAAIVLREGEAFAHGSFDLAPLLAVWPRGAVADELPARSFGTLELRALPLPLREALTRANVGLGVTPILSPRRRWGHLFMNTGLLGGLFDEEDLVAFEAFVAQLALVLDAADLLARAVAVERSLAHAEKLAALGELAARFAHEIRNPVTAARSLAQQLAREPGAPFAEEHGLILEELARVERQVAALLRFSRRDEYRFERVDVGALVRAAVEGFRPRLEALGATLALDVAEGVHARADAEKLRQVVVNLVENALDAVAEAAPGRRLAVAVANGGGRACVRVADDGPGIPPDALPRLFEPFFSLKATGTGLGLAIAKRTVDAHAGRIAVESAPGAGTAVDVELPLAGE
jgi:signal transduction histidine kinase